MEIRKILRQYIFSLILVLCVASFFCGVINVREKTGYNMNMIPYNTVKVEKNEEGIFLISGENESFVIPDLAEKVKKLIIESRNNIF